MCLIVTVSRFLSLFPCLSFPVSLSLSLVSCLSFLVSRFLSLFPCLSFLVSRFLSLFYNSAAPSTAGEGQPSIQGEGQEERGEGWKVGGGLGLMQDENDVDGCHDGSIDHPTPLLAPSLLVQRLKVLYLCSCCSVLQCVAVCCSVL